MKINHVINMIKEYGVAKCVGRVLYNKVNRFLTIIYKGFLKKTKIDPKKILFMSVPSFSDNAWFMYDYLHSVLDESYSFVWLSNYNERMRMLKDRTKNILQRTFYCSKSPTLKALKEIATSKYIFFTHGSPNEWIPPHRGQVIINLWHGCGIKDVEKNNTDQRIFDIALVPGKAFIKTKARFWGCDVKKIKTIGYPRYDCMLKDDVKTEQWIDRIKKEMKLVIWMPTFRKTQKHEYPEDGIQYEYDLPLLNNKDQMDELNSFCNGKNVILCIKRHPFQIAYSAEDNNFSNILFMSNNTFLDNNIELYSFLRYTDALISDYSSVAIDYLLLDKPIAYSLDDFEAYKNTRGFIVEDPLAFMPGHHLYDFKDLLQFLEDVSTNKDPYQAQRHELLPLVHNLCNNYCERVWQEIKDLEISR